MLNWLSWVMHEIFLPSFWLMLNTRLLTFGRLRNFRHFLFRLLFFLSSHLIMSQQCDGSKSIREAENLKAHAMESTKIFKKVLKFIINTPQNLFKHSSNADIWNIYLEMKNVYKRASRRKIFNTTQMAIGISSIFSSFAAKCKPKHPRVNSQNIFVSYHHRFACKQDNKLLKKPTLKFNNDASWWEKHF